MRHVLVLTGIPGSGKSTVARLVASSLPRSALIAGDDLRDMVISGRSDPNDPWDDEMRSQYHLSFEREARLALSFLRSGFAVVIDEVITPGDLYDEWRRNFTGVSHQVVLLLPGLAVAVSRNHERPEKTVPERTLHTLDDARAERRREIAGDLTHGRAAGTPASARTIAPYSPGPTRSSPARRSPRSRPAHGGRSSSPRSRSVGLSRPSSASGCRPAVSTLVF